MEAVEEGLDASVDGIGAAASLDEIGLVVTRVGAEDVLLLVVGNQWCSLLVIGLETLADSLGLIVVTLDEGLTGDVIFALLLRGVEVVGVDTARARVGPAAADTSDDLLIGNLEVEGGVDLDLLLELGSLVSSAGETVEKNVISLVLLKLGEDHLDHEFIRDESTRVHERSSLDTKLGLVTNLLAENVTSGDVEVAIVLDEALADGTLTTTGGA